MPKKPVSPYKLATLPEWQQQRIKADEERAKVAQVQNSSLKTFSPKRLAKLGGRTLFSSFTPKHDAKPLQRRRRINGTSVYAVTRQPMAKGKPLRYQGRRGKRLAPGDQKGRAEITGLPCVCGCNRKTVWVHLKTRSSEALRHLSWVTVPGCVDLDFWMDQGPGAAVKAELFALAESLQQRMTEADITPVLSANGYYTWLYDKRRLI